MSVELAERPGAWVEKSFRARIWEAIRTGISRAVALSIVELQKLRRDKTELITWAIQPALWLAVFGLTSAGSGRFPPGTHPVLVGTPSHLGLDALVLGLSATAAVIVAAALLPRLAR